MSHYISYTSTVDGQHITTLQVLKKPNGNIVINLDFNNEEEYSQMKSALGSRVYYQEEESIDDIHTLALLSTDEKLIGFFINQILRHKPDLNGIVEKLHGLGINLYDAYYSINELPLWIESFKDETIKKDGQIRRLQVRQLYNTADKTKIKRIIIRNIHDQPGFQIMAEYTGNIQGKDLLSIIGDNPTLFMRLLSMHSDYFDSQAISPETTGTLETYLNRIRQIEPGLTTDVYNRLVDVVNSLHPAGSELINHQYDNAEVFYDAMEPPKELSFIGQFDRMLDERENRQAVESLISEPDESYHDITSAEHYDAWWKAKNELRAIYDDNARRECGCYSVFDCFKDDVTSERFQKFMQLPDQIKRLEQEYREHQSFENALSPSSFTSKKEQPPAPVSYTTQLNSQLCFLTWLSSSLCALLPSHWSRSLNGNENQQLCKIKTESTVENDLSLLRSSIIYHSDLYQDHVNALIRDWRIIKYTIPSILKLKHTSDVQYNQLVQSYDAVVLKITELKSINDNIQNKHAYVPAGQCLVMQYSVKKGGIQFKLESIEKTNKADPIICKSDFKSCFDFGLLQQLSNEVVNPCIQGALPPSVSGKLRQ